MSLGIPELVVLIVIVLLFFGPSRLPGLGKSVGSAIRGFKKGISSDDEVPKKIHPPVDEEKKS
jgi:sec-independent protein translocase protein TatA